MNAIIRINERTNYITVLCPIGHVLEARKADATFGGSSFEAELSAHAHGRPNRFDRLAASCCGAGH